MVNGQGGSNWLATLPDGVTFSQSGVTTGPYFLDNAHPVLNINYKYDLAAVFDPTLPHGITSIQFADLAGSGESNDTGNGLRGQISINFVNNLGVPLGKSTGTPFFIYLGDLQSDAENNPVHPLYAHFHGVGTTYGGLTATPGTFSGLGTPGAPSTINLTGIIPTGTTASIGPVVLHERDQASLDDSFSLNFFPTADTLSPTDRATLQAQWDAAHPPAHITAVYRFFDTATGDHFYTLSTAEKNQIQATLPTYNYEGVGWATPDKGADTIDVFRFYDTNTHQHFFTVSAAERDQVIKTLPTYQYEGVAFEAYASPAAAGSGAVTLERFFNTNTGLHHYAANADEAFAINHGSAGPGWIDEGKAFTVHVPTDGMLFA
jgi:hypothetical protein